ncbi:MAG: molecular chaperone TorD family protein [Planctomycetota bacterium]
MTDETSANALPASELALARARLYELLGEIFANGVTISNLSFVQSIEELNTAIPEPFDPDAAAAAHYEIFEHQVPPYESIFVGESGLIGGAPSDRVRDTFHLIGFDGISNQRNCDHVSQLFTALGFLCRRRQDQIVRGQSDDPELTRGFHALFYEHLLLWFHSLALAVIEQGDPFYSHVVILALELVETHSREIETETFRQREGHSSLPVVSEPASKVGPDIDVENDVVATHELIEQLIRPSGCGFYFTRKLIQDLGRMISLPRGFTSRETMLQNLFQSAEKFESRKELVLKLDGFCKTAGKYYASRFDSRPHLKICLSGRIEALERTRKMLKRFDAQRPAQ